jgi:hypothetical protein
MTINKLQREIQKTLDSLAATRPLLKGSISKVTLSKKTRTRGGRVAHLLTYKGEGNRTKSIYIKNNQLQEVKAMIQNYRKLKTTVNKLITLNVMLFKTSSLSSKSS